MSRSNKNSFATNPAKRFYTFAGSKGLFTYYDKEAGQNIETEAKDFPRFAVLDELHVIGGFCDRLNRGIYSNEVRDLSKQKLKVRCGRETLAEGYYSEDSFKVKAQKDGAKYGKSIYAVLFQESNNWILVNIKLTGAALSSYISFTQGENDYKGQPRVRPEDVTLTVRRSEQKKKGKTLYFDPIFESHTTTDEEEKAAIELDKVLQAYLKEYFSQGTQPEPEYQDETKAEAEAFESEAEEVVDIDENELPF